MEDSVLEPEEDEFVGWPPGDAFFQLDLLHSMLTATGWRQGPIDPEVQSAYEAILAGENPIELANEWMRAHRIPEPVPPGVHEELPPDDGDEGED
jgi:hypothetical protein